MGLGRISSCRELNILLIKGLILDSGPGPMGLFDVTFNSFFNNQSFMALPLYLFAVNAANKVELKENLNQVKYQLGKLSHSRSLYKSVPWTGRFMSYNEKGSWPVLFLYSKEDRMMPWKYIQRVIAMQAGIYILPKIGYFCPTPCI